MRNIAYIYFTLDTFQSLSGWLKDSAPQNKGENDEGIARLEDEKDLVLRALGGALARKSTQEAKITALTEHGAALEHAAAETEKSLGRLAETRRAIDEPRR